MSYTVDFVGLVNFFDQGDAGKLLLLPDGREPDNDKIPPHFAHVIVLEQQLVDADEWTPDNDPKAKELKVLKFQIDTPATIWFTGQGARRGLSTARQDGLLPLLKKIDPKINILPEQAATIAQIPIDYGTLEAFRIGAHSFCSRLTVDTAAATVVVEMDPDDGSKLRTLRLNEGAEVLITNMSALAESAPIEDVSHFTLYGQLDVDRDGSRLVPPRLRAADALSQLPSAHPYVELIRSSGGAIPAPGCSVTGCCPCCEP